MTGKICRQSRGKIAANQDESCTAYPDLLSVRFWQGNCIHPVELNRTSSPRSIMFPRFAIISRFAALALGAICMVGAGGACAQVRIKDIADFEGIRENMLVGYGLVVGLNATGDTLTNSPFTKQSLVGMLERLGINVRDDTVKTQNVAAVMVTATLPAFARTGSRVDMVVSALGDASSLLGGTLLVTPLIGADGEVYAVGQGNVAVSGFQAKGQGASITKGVPTAGRIPNGAIVEREVGFELASIENLRLALRNPDFTTATRVAQSINSHLGGSQRPRDRPRDGGAGRAPRAARTTSSA